MTSLKSYKLEAPPPPLWTVENDKLPNPSVIKDWPLKPVVLGKVNVKSTLIIGQANVIPLPLACSWFVKWIAKI